MKLQIGQVAAYLTQHFQSDVQVLQLKKLGTGGTEQFTAALLAQNGHEVARHKDETLKTFSYGNPVLVECLINGRYARYVLQTRAANQFDHQYRSDRAAEILLQYDTFNELPQHSRALDAGMITADHQLISVADGSEFFLLTEYVRGMPYAQDLQRLQKSGAVTGVDLLRARQLALYLAQIHSVPGTDSTLYTRRIRQLLGSGEGIMGLIDSYNIAPNGQKSGVEAKRYTKNGPAGPSIDASWFEEFEKVCISWRWRLKAKGHRLTQVHGDFHPFNALFERNGTLHTLARSRGAWGEPADDVASMAINYLFFALQCDDQLSPPFEQLWNIFWNTYLSTRNDPELLTVIAPFFAWRALVLASPLWYNISHTIRKTLLTFARAVLLHEVFEPAKVNHYLCNHLKNEPVNSRHKAAMGK
ncbi:MAG: phosphotransferase [Caldilineaceae bacterium]